MIEKSIQKIGEQKRCINWEGCIWVQFRFILKFDMSWSFLEVVRRVFKPGWQFRVVKFIDFHFQVSFMLDVPYMIFIGVHSWNKQLGETAVF